MEIQKQFGYASYFSRRFSFAVDWIKCMHVNCNSYSAKLLTMGKIVFMLLIHFDAVMIREFPILNHINYSNFVSISNCLKQNLL